MRHALILALLATPAFADDPLDGDGFEALVEGKTLTFSNLAGPYGVEYYAPDRRVIWSFIGGDCVNGEWFEEVTETGPNICFTYENDPEPKCWKVFEDDGRIRAEFVTRPGTTVLYQVEASEPLVCGGLGA